VQTYAALVWTYGRVELNSVAAVYLNLAVIVNPGNTEENLSFRLNYSFKHAVFL
jgi:hypothetical protein